MTLTRRLLGVAVAAAALLTQVGISGGTPVSALDDCQQKNNTNGSPWTCGFTQLDPNHNWPWDGSAPQCQTCAWWDMPGGKPGNVDADFSGIGNSANGAVRFNDDLINAMYDWASQPYNSPLMYQCSGSNCQYSQIHDGWKDEGSTGSFPCALTYVYVDSSSRVTSSTIMYNNNGGVRWWDGPPASGQRGCDAKSIAYHEEGHVYTLGHSSVAADVMYWSGNTVASVTADAQNGLNAIYGPYTGNSGGNGSCPNCRTICRMSVDPCALGGSFNLQGYLDKAWDMSQGVSLPNPVSYVAPIPACLSYWYAQDWVNWSQCAEAYLLSRIPKPMP
ncbi:MAG TPA: matrixin family metalloprotease [Candidatus Angelobacter sp.]|nr:matrixin family metalloprotease [Candidatus Angelobacter sp.]